MSRSIRTCAALATLTVFGLLGSVNAFAGTPPTPIDPSQSGKQDLVPDQNGQQQSSPRFQEYTDNNLGVRGVLTPKGFMVTHVTPGGVMEKLGLEEDDVILTVDGQSVRSWDDWKVSFSRQHAPNEPIALRIRDWRTRRTVLRYLDDL